MTDKRKRTWKSNAKNTSKIDEQIGTKINQLRLSQGVTRRAMATQLGITHQQLQKYERGINRISIGRLMDIAEVLTVSATYFFEDFVEDLTPATIDRQRRCMEMMRDFLEIKREDQQDAVRRLIKVLREEEV